MKRISIDTVAIYGIAVLAFALSYSKLTDLALRAGYGEIMAHAWPLIVDGLAVLSARAVLHLRGGAHWYAWSLVVVGTAISCASAVAGALFAGDQLPAIVAAAVRFVPPLCVPFALHLAKKMREVAEREEAQVETASQPVRTSQSTVPEPRAVATPDDTPPGIAADVECEPPLHLVTTNGAKPRSEKPRSAKFTEAQIAEALALVAAGVSQREVGRRMGCSGNAVRGWVAKAQQVA
ncbi:DUF2637 domain-containing protein [Rhodococcus opacus]|uniref:DUF2637 domain-containing protein n=1 Tax=Rhodococcus opacus TaxID=37919 RepID=UPI0018E47A4F|nr:DUF2637 domain-containing protein [Rhodococcus opacus]